MSLRGLFNHRAEVWRPVESRGFAAEVRETLEPVSRPKSGFNMAIVPAAGRMRGLTTTDIGPGETSRGTVEVYLPKGMDVEDRDILNVVAGPEAPATYRVVAMCRPRGHHVEATVEPWVGELVG